MMRKITIAALITLAVGPALAQSPPAGTPTRRFAPDSPLEEDGFELLVPQSQEIILRAHRDRPSAPCSPRESDTPHERDRGFESAFLQRRIALCGDFQGFVRPTSTRIAIKKSAHPPSRWTIRWSCHDERWPRSSNFAILAREFGPSGPGSICSDHHRLPNRPLTAPRHRVVASYPPRRPEIDWPMTRRAATWCGASWSGLSRSGSSAR